MIAGEKKLNRWVRAIGAVALLLIAYPVTVFAVEETDLTAKDGEVAGDTVFPSLPGRRTPSRSLTQMR